VERGAGPNPPEVIKKKWSLPTARREKPQRKGEMRKRDVLKSKKGGNVGVDAGQGVCLETRHGINSLPARGKQFLSSGTLGFEASCSARGKKMKRSTSEKQLPRAAGREGFRGN